MNSDIISIKNLELWSHIGVLEEERSRPQRLSVSIEMVTDSRAAAESDDISLAIDYAAVAQAVKTLVAARPRRLIETLAEEIAQMVLQRFTPRSVTVELEKFALKDTHSVSVKITRSQHA